MRLGKCEEKSKPAPLDEATPKGCNTQRKCDQTERPLARLKGADFEAEEDEKS